MACFVNTSNSPKNFSTLGFKRQIFSLSHSRRISIISQGITFWTLAGFFRFHESFFVKPNNSQQHYKRSVSVKFGQNKKQFSICHCVAYKILILNIYLFCMVWYIHQEMFRIWKILVKTLSQNIFRTERLIAIKHIFLEWAQKDLQNDIHINDFCKSHIVIQWRINLFFYYFQG